MKRYDVYTDGMGYIRIEMVADGDWVKHSDALEAIEAVRQEERAECERTCNALAYACDVALGGAGGGGINGRLMRINALERDIRASGDK